MTRFTAAVIPSAGLGTRMRALFGDRPKALLEVAGRSLLGHAIAEARDAGLERIVVVANPAAHDALGAEARRFAPRSQVVDQAVPRGLADAIRLGALVLPGEAFAVLLPDNLFVPPSPLARLVAIAAGSGEHAVLVARMNAETARGKGGSAPASVEPLGPDPDAVRIRAVGAKRPKGQLELGPEERFDTPIGRYAFQGDIAQEITAVERALKPGEELDDVPLLARLAAAGRLCGLLYRTPFADVGNPDGYRAAQQLLASAQSGTARPAPAPGQGTPPAG
ncbi:MAG TPA: NTP transferase domain-containing protein [Gemmatimonadales bacterium]|nr:NTP transferase domain-containing protein [Gemmatimonadales bacterium]